MAKVTIDYSKCTGQLTCIDVCPVAVFEKGEDGKAKVVREQDCTACHACESSCPEGAITVED